LVNQLSLYKKLKTNTDSRLYQDLITLLEFRKDTILKQFIECVDYEETIRLQGRAKELSDLLQGLTRKPIEDSHSTGAFN